MAAKYGDTEELSPYQEDFYDWKLAKLTGWTPEYIQTLPWQKINRYFAIEEGFAKARK
jgi:hypothetical protein